MKHIFVCGWPYWVVANFMVAWGWEACAGNVVCYVICTIVSKWDLSRIVEEAWKRCEKTIGLVPYHNLWHLVLCFDFSMLTLHHFGGPLDLRLNLRHQATMRI